MDSAVDDTMFLIPTIFISSPLVNEALFASVSGESCDIASAFDKDDDDYQRRSDVCYRSSISPDYESDTDAHEALYANLIEKRYEVEKLTEDVEEIPAEKSSRDSSDKLFNVAFETSPCPVWASDPQNVYTKKSETFPIKPTPYDSLDSLLSKIADSVRASNKQEGTQSAVVPEELHPEEAVMPEELLPEEAATFCAESDVADNVEESFSTAPENFDTRDAEEIEDQFDANERLSPVFFTQALPDEVSRPSSRDMSDRERLMVFDDTPVVKKSRHTYSPIVSKLLDANCYIKPEGSYHLPTKSLAFLNNKNPTSDYNPYYAFLPEYSATNKIHLSKTRFNIKNGVARDKFAGSKLIKSCEFSRKSYPQDPLRFLTYVKSNNTGGDCHVSSDIQYNPYYTFLPKFDKSAVNNIEGSSSFEMSAEVVKEVTHYEVSQRNEMDISPDMPHEGMGDGPPRECGKVSQYKASKVEKLPVIVERQKSFKNIDTKNEKRDSCTEVNSDELIQTTGFDGSISDCRTPVVAIFPQDLLPETYMTEPMVAVISHLFRDNIPEPIVHETLSYHSGDGESYSCSEELCNIEASVDAHNSAQLFVAEELGCAEVNPEDVVGKESESSTWRDIGWQSAHRLLDDSDDLSHREDSSEVLQTRTIDDLKEVVWKSVESFGFNEEYSDLGNCLSFTEKNALEPPEDFANTRKRSEPLVMSSIYEHPHRHQEILPDMLSSMSSGALLRYQYVGCPLCSSSSTVIDDEDLELLLSHRFLSQTTTEEPEQKTRNSKSEAIPVPASSVRQGPARTTSPARKVVTIARQLLHPQVDSFLASQAKQRQRNEYESSYVGDPGFDDYVGFTPSPLRRGILANVRLAAGGSLYMQPSMPRQKMEAERSVSAGHGDGQGRTHYSGVQMKSVRSAHPRSAPPSPRRELDLMKVSGENSTHLRVMASPGQYDVISASGKGDEVSTVDQITQSTECENNRSECVLLDKEKMFIFSWETDSSNEDCQDIRKRSYTLLHWTDSPYKSPPKQMLADLLKRVISGVSSYHLQSKSLSGIVPTINVHRARSLPKRVAAVHHTSSGSSKSLSQIGRRKCRFGTVSKIREPDDHIIDDMGTRKVGNEDENLHGKLSIPLCHKHQCETLTKKSKIVTRKRTVTFRDNAESSDSDEHLEYTKQAFALEGTPSELNVFVGSPLLSESAIYTWWNQKRKAKTRSTQQMLLDTSSNYSLSSSSSEDCDFISWT